MTQNDRTVLAIMAVVGVGAFFMLRQPARATPIFREPVYGTGSGLVYLPPAPTIPTRAPEVDEPGMFDTFVKWFADFGTEEEKTPSQWRAELLPLIRRQEAAFAMPPNLLEAVIENESSFRHDIITGIIEGSAGEQGIMQLKPQYHMDSAAERNNPHLAIPYGATYLAKNFLRFGNWREAVIAYNCGPTDWENYGAAKCGAALNYVSKIEARIGSLGPVTASTVTTTIGIRG